MYDNWHIFFNNDIDSFHIDVSEYMELNINYEYTVF